MNALARFRTAAIAPYAPRTGGILGRALDFFRGSGIPAPVPLQSAAYARDVRDQVPRVSIQSLTAADFTTAFSAYTLGNPYLMSRLVDLMLSSDPEIRAALKQLKTSIGRVPFIVNAANDSTIAQKIADGLRTAIENPSLNVRRLKRWIVEGHVRGVGLIEAVWNPVTEPIRTWERFTVVPQQRIRLNRSSGEVQFASSPFVFQGLDVSMYDRGKWIVVQPDEHISDFGLRGVAPALVADWFGRLNVMGWWNMALERDAMKTLVGKAGSDADAVALDLAFKNRGAAGAYLIRNKDSDVKELAAAQGRSGVSLFGEYMTHTGQRLFLALLGESQTGIIEKDAGSKQSADTQHEVADSVYEDLCEDIAFVGRRDLFVPWVIQNHGIENVANTPTWEPQLDDAVDVVALNEAIAGRPKNVQLGKSWYYKQTQWSPPAAGEEPLADPTPVPAFGAAPAQPDTMGKPGTMPDASPANPNEKPAKAGEKQVAA
jgi:Protein of unknown function (DUF935)